MLFSIGANAVIFYVYLCSVLFLPLVFLFGFLFGAKFIIGEQQMKCAKKFSFPIHSRARDELFRVHEIRCRWSWEKIAALCMYLFLFCASSSFIAHIPLAPTCTLTHAGQNSIYMQCQGNERHGREGSH